MDIIEIEKEFNWVIKVLNSSINNNHINTSIRLFEVFLEKWDWEMSDEKKLSLHGVFNRNKTQKYSQINYHS
jgi:hypothetical protein